MLTANRKTLKCCGHSKIKLNIGHAQPKHIEALIVLSPQLGFDLFEINAIRDLGRVHIAGSGEVHFPGVNVAWSAVISINEPHFSAEFVIKRYGWPLGNG